MNGIQINMLAREAQIVEGTLVDLCGKKGLQLFTTLERKWIREGKAEAGLWTTGKPILINMEHIVSAYAADLEPWVRETR